MKLIRKFQRLRSMLPALLLAGLVAGCVEEAKLNTDTVTYQAEERPLEVIAGEDGEFEPGSTVTLNGRLVGTVNDETVIWAQTGGQEVTVDDWTATPLTFTAPVVDGIENFTFTITALDGEGNVILRNIVDEDGNPATEPMMDEVTITVFDPASLITYEVEDSNVTALNIVVLTGEGQDQYISGAVGTHTRDFTPGATATFTLDTNALEDLSAGFYTLYVRYAIPASGYGEKGTIVTVNGVANEFMVPATGSWDNYRVGIVSMEEGVNTIEIGGGWNYYRVDSISFIPAAPPAGPLPVPPTLVNTNASQEALALMEYLTSNYGSATLSGQTEFTNYGNGTTGLIEFNKIIDATGGDAPAIVAFDLMDYSASRVDCGATPGTLSEDMIAVHGDNNPILSALWHWNAPMHLVDDTCSSDVSGEAWWHGFYTTATSFDLSAALADTGSAEYAALLADIDAVAAELAKFQEADIPILWRPLHEAEGGWFWWGNAGADALKELWILMYQRMTDTHGLNNLIWVFTHAGSLDENWFPGEAYVDIVGYDGYDGDNRENPFQNQYNTLKNRFNARKLVALTETGTIPNVATMHSVDAWWSFFITWNSGSDQYGPDNAAPADIADSYAYEGVLNLDDVPGGREKTYAGLYAGFEPDLQGWHAQIGWSNADGTTTSDGWASSGRQALMLAKNLVEHGSASDIVFQNYPEGGVDVTGMTTMTIKAYATGAGDAVDAHIFWKSGADESWPAAVPVTAEGVELTIDLTVDSLDGLGVRFNGVDPASTDARFYIDEITLSDGSNSSILYDFEPELQGWHAQISWSNTGGTTTSTEWSNDGARALALYKDLVEHGSASDIVFQNYRGLDVTDKSTMTIQVHALGAGDSVNAHIFWKSGADESWPDAVAVTSEGVELTIDVSTVDMLDGFGVRFNGVDAFSTNARFFVDSIAVDGESVYDFEGTGDWGFQVGWANQPGIQLASDWSAEGSYALAAQTQLANGDDDIVFQIYPADGILFGEEITTLRITAYAEDAGDNLTAHIFWKGTSTESWPAGVPVTAEGVELSVDIDVEELTGFGVRFQSPNNSATPSRYYIDNVVFE